MDKALCKAIINGQVTVESIAPLQGGFEFICRTEDDQDQRVSGTFRISSIYSFD